MSPVDDAFTLFDDTSLDHVSHGLTSHDDANDAMTRFLGNQPIHARMRTRDQRHSPPGVIASSTPVWLDAYTTRSGDDPRLVGTRAIPRTCLCGRLVLVGYDAPVIAGLATVDPYQATPQLEAAAVILATATYQLWGDPGRYELTPRHVPGLRALGTKRPAGDVLVVLAHTCHRPPLATTPLPAPARPARPGDVVPF